jgi:hypothetical protein
MSSAPWRGNPSRPNSSTCLVEPVIPAIRSPSIANTITLLASRQPLSSFSVSPIRKATGPHAAEPSHVTAEDRDVPN